MRSLCPTCREEVSMQLSGFGKMRCPSCGSFHEKTSVRTDDQQQVGPPKKPRRRRRYRYR